MFKEHNYIQAIIRNIMLYNRKNTSKVVASWKNYLNNSIINEERNVKNSEPNKLEV